jgi:hypothetical protein
LYGTKDLTWTDNCLRYGRRVVATIEPDPDWVGMWRVRLPNGRLTDMVNRTRAKDAAVCLALSYLNAPRQPIRDSPIRFSERAATSVQPST